jgi:oxalate decarboxylase
VDGPTRSRSASFRLLIAGINIRITAGSHRELHWQAADEWAYVLYGHAHVTVTNPDGSMFIGDVSEDDLWIFPAGYPHFIQGLGPERVPVGFLSGWVL